MINRIILFYIFVDLIIATILYLSSNAIWLLNTQIAFFSSLLILIGSFVSNKKNITSRLDGFKSNEFANRDEIDMIEDRFDLYSEEENFDNSEESKESESSIIKEEKKKFGFFQSLQNLKYSKSSLSLYRISGYLFLVIGFFFLHHNALLHIYSYLIGFFIVPFLSIIAGFTLKFE